MPYRFMLDTNTFGELVSDRSETVRARFRSEDIRSICVSAITRGEVEFGLARKPEAVRLARIAARLFEQIDVLAWTTETAQNYGRLRAGLQRSGVSMGPLDTLIGAHALQAGVTLVTSDKAFRHMPGLIVENWLES